MRQNSGATSQWAIMDNGQLTLSFTGLANENFTYTSSQIVMILQGTLLYTGDKEDTSLSKQLVP